MALRTCRTAPTPRAPIRVLPIAPPLSTCRYALGGYHTALDDREARARVLSYPLDSEASGLFPKEAPPQHFLGCCTLSLGRVVIPLGGVKAVSPFPGDAGSIA